MVARIGLSSGAVVDVDVCIGVDVGIKMGAGTCVCAIVWVSVGVGLRGSMVARVGMGVPEVRVDVCVSVGTWFFVEAS